MGEKWDRGEIDKYTSDGGIIDVGVLRPSSWESSRGELDGEWGRPESWKGGGMIAEPGSGKNVALGEPSLQG